MKKRTLRVTLLKQLLYTPKELFSGMTYVLCKVCFISRILLLQCLSLVLVPGLCEG